MASTLLDALQGMVTPQLLAAASSRSGEPEVAVSKGLRAALPLILGGLMQKTNDPNSLSQLIGLLNSRADNESEVLANPAKALAEEQSSSGLMDLAKRLISMLFGTRSSKTTGALAEYAGIRNTSASSLMTLAGVMVSSVLGDRIRREHLSTTALAGLLSGQRDSVVSALPGALSNAAGLSAARDLGSPTTPTRHEEHRRGIPVWLWPLAAVFLLALGIWSLWSPRKVDEVARSTGSAAHAVGQAATDSAQRAGQAASDAFADLGAFTTRHLSTNVDLSVPERGVESSVIAYLNDTSKPLDGQLWFNFDRLLFETGSATLQPRSNEQLHNVAEIMKAYPAVKIEIGGYTDNTGDPAANLKLSQDRAMNVRSAIVALGITPDRLSAEGYGEQFPVADNATAEGRQQNRRIALHVTAK